MNLAQATTGGDHPASFYLWASMVGSIPDNKSWEKFPIETNWITPSSISSSASLSACPVEPLSERELQVLHLLDSSLTSIEIGRELFLSQNTVHTHIRNIYSKLAVHGRIEAIQKAKAVDLI